MRLLPKQRDELSIQGLGFADDHLKMIRNWGKLSNGIVLVTAQQALKSRPYMLY